MQLSSREGEGFIQIIESIEEEKYKKKRIDGKQGKRRRLQQSNNNNNNNWRYKIIMFFLQVIVGLSKPSFLN